MELKWTKITKMLLKHFSLLVHVNECSLMETFYTVLQDKLIVWQKKNVKSTFEPLRLLALYIFMKFPLYIPIMLIIMNYIYKSLLIKMSTLYLLHFIAFPSKKKTIIMHMIL